MSKPYKGSRVDVLLNIPIGSELLFEEEPKKIWHTITMSPHLSREEYRCEKVLVILNRDMSTNVRCRVTRLPTVKQQVVCECDIPCDLRKTVENMCEGCAAIKEQRL